MATTQQSYNEYMSSQVASKDDLARWLVRKHLVIAQRVRNRLDSAEKGDPLKVGEITSGVPVPHDEYIALVELAAQAINRPA